MGILLVLGVIGGGAAITSVFVTVSEHMYIMSDNIHAHLCGGFSPRKRASSDNGM